MRSLSSPNTEHHWLAQDESKSYSFSLSWPYFGLFLYLLKSCDVNKANIIMPISQMKELGSGSLSQATELS